MRILLIILIFLTPFIVKAQSTQTNNFNQDFLLRSNKTTTLGDGADTVKLTLISTTPKVCKFLFLFCSGGMADIVINYNNSPQRLDVIKNQIIPIEKGSLLIKEVNTNQIKARLNKPTIKSSSREIANIGDQINIKVEGVDDKNPIIDFAPQGNLLYASKISPRIEGDGSFTFSIPDGVDPLCFEPSCPGKPIQVTRGDYLISLRSKQGQSQVVPLFVIESPKKLLIKNPAQLPRAIAGRDYSASLEAQGASEDIVWELTAGNLPDGLSLTQKPCSKSPCLYNAIISGRPNDDLTNENYEIEVRARTKTQTTKKNFKISLIDKETPFIEIRSPMKQINLSPNSKFEIEWDSKDVERVNITLERSGKVELVIADNIPNNNSFVWNVPRGIIDASNYVVRVRSIDQEVLDITDDFISISKQPFKLSAIKELRSQYQPNMKPTALVVGTEFNGSTIKEDRGYSLNAKLFDFKNRDISPDILEDNRDIEYDAKKGGWPIIFKRTISNGLYLLKLTLTCEDEGRGQCGDEYGTDGYAEIEKPFSILGSDIPQLTGIEQNILSVDDELKLRGYQLSTTDGAIIIRSNENALLGGAYELSAIVETGSIDRDAVEISLPDEFKIIPVRKNIDLNLINDINNSPITSEPMDGNYTVSFVSPKGISNSLPITISNRLKKLSLITGYERLQWTFPSLRRIEWLSTSPIFDTQSPKRVSIYLDSSRCSFLRDCSNTDGRIILSRNTPNDGVYEWDGKAENGALVPDGDYSIIIVDTNNPEVSAISENKLTVSNTSIRGR